MSTKFWLSADDKYFYNAVDFTAHDEIVIPVVQVQTGSSRNPVYPGVYRSPRIRTLADKFGTPTTLSTPKEITFAAIVYGTTMDDIYVKWKRINSYLDRAEMASSPFPRGTGVVFVEQINDAADLTFWDVISGVLTDVDFNLPGTDMVAAVLQLSVLPFSRGRPISVPFGAVRINGTGSTFYLPYPGGDAPGLFELQLKDMSAPGHEITWVTIGRRWAPSMAQSDFTSWYPLSYTIQTGQTWQQMVAIGGSASWDSFTWDSISWDEILFSPPLSNDSGAHQTGLFGVYAIVNDAAVIIGDPTDINLTPSFGNGTIANGYIEVALVPKDSNGNGATPTARFLLTINNPNQPGNVQDSEDFETGKWDTWLSLPATVVAAGGSAALSIDPAAAIRGTLGAHFKVVGNSTGGSITSASATRLMPPMTTAGFQSVAFDVKPVSWGSWLSTTPISPPAAPIVTTGPATPIPPPSVTPSGSATSATATVGFPASAAYQPVSVAFTWVNAYGETTIGPSSSVTWHGTNPFVVNILIPSLPAGVIGANVYYKEGAGYPYFLWNTTGPLAPGFYNVYPNSSVIQPPTVNTTGGTTQFSAGQVYYVGLTWLNAYGQTTIGTLAAFSNASNFNATVTVPAFPAGVTQAAIWVSRGTSGTTVSLVKGVSAPGVTSINQGNGVYFPPASNTTGNPPAGSWDVSPRFTWGSMTIVPSGTQNNFVLNIAGTQIGGAFNLAPGVVHTIGANFRQVGTQGIYSLIVDNVIIGSLAGAIGTVVQLPITAVWTAIAAGTGGPYTEEWYLDNIYIYDADLRPGFNTTGNAIITRFTPDAQTANVDFYYALHPTGQTGAVQWYQIQSVSSPFILSTPVPASAIPVQGPPTGSPQSSYAQLQARVGVGTNAQMTINKNVVRTSIANGIDELVRLGSIELPPGAKSDNRDLDGWTLEIWGKSGANSTDNLTVKGVILFPEDEDGWIGLTAKWFGNPVTNGEIHIGTNRYGRSYAQLFAADGVTMLGYADVTGAIGTMPGDQNFVILTGRDDGQGHLIMDLAQQFRVGCTVTPRFHWESTEIGRP